MITRPRRPAQGRPLGSRPVRFLMLAAVLIGGCATTPPMPKDPLSRPPSVLNAPTEALPNKPAKAPEAQPTQPKPLPTSSETTPGNQPDASPPKPVKARKELKKDSLLYKILHPVELITGQKRKPKVEPGLAAPSTDLWEEYRKRSVLPDCSDSPLADRYAREYAGMQSFMDRTMVRAEPFLYFILEQARAEGVPSDLVLLPIIESQFDPELASSQGAAGMWQFMPSTGRLMGLSISPDYDGRLDAFASTQAAMRYFKRLATRFDDNYLLAMAAYNVGDGRLLRELRGRFPPFTADTVFSLQLPAETKNHVAKWQGLSCLFKDPARYDFELPTIAFKPQLRKVDVGDQVDLAKVSELSRLEVDWLKHLNPGYRRAQTPAAGPNYFLLPVSNADRLDSALKRMGPAERSLLAAQGASPIRTTLPGMTQPVPVSGLRDPAVRAAMHAASASSTSYTVASGDSAWKIARAQGVPLNGLLAVNGLTRSSSLRVGQRLKLPGGAAATTKAASAAPAAVSAAMIHHEVRAGDSTWKIARRYQVSLETLLKLNGISRSTRIKPGMRLRVK